MFLLSGPDHGRISAMPHKVFQEKQQERPVVPKGQYVPAARRQGGGTNEKRRHTSKAAVRTQARQQRTGKAAATGKTKAAAPRRAARNSGGPGCPCAPSSGFVLRCSARGSPSLAFSFPRGFSRPARADRPSVPSFLPAGDPLPLSRGRAPAAVQSRLHRPPSARRDRRTFPRGRRPRHRSSRIRAAPGR